MYEKLFFDALRELSLPDSVVTFDELVDGIFSSEGFSCQDFATFLLNYKSNSTEVPEEAEQLFWACMGRFSSIEASATEQFALYRLVFTKLGDSDEKEWDDFEDAWWGEKGPLNISFEKLPFAEQLTVLGEEIAFLEAEPKTSSEHTRLNLLGNVSALFSWLQVTDEDLKVLVDGFGGWHDSDSQPNALEWRALYNLIVRLTK